MAIDLNRPIGAAAAPSTALPSKRTMNLLVRERKTSGWGKYVIAALGLALVVALFAKFAVFDVYDRVEYKRAELTAAQAELTAVQQQVSGYDSVLADYHAYTSAAPEGGTDALLVLDMVARVVQPSATVTSAAVSDSTLQISVKDISLDALGKLADALRSQEMVDSVVVSNASDENESNVSASLLVALVQDGEGGDE